MTFQQFSDDMTAGTIPTAADIQEEQAAQEQLDRQDQSQARIEQLRVVTKAAAWLDNRQTRLARQDLLLKRHQQSKRFLDTRKAGRVDVEPSASTGEH